MPKKFNARKWLKAMSIRALKMMAQSAIALIGTTTLVSEINFKALISAVILSGLLSVLTSIARLPEFEETD